jgi:hypothetical protein
MSSHNCTRNTSGMSVLIDSVLVRTLGWIVFPAEIVLVTGIIAYFLKKAKQRPRITEYGSSSISIITFAGLFLGGFAWGILGVLLESSCLNVTILTYLCIMVIATMLLEREVVVYFQFYLVGKVHGIAKTRNALERRVVRQSTQEGNIRLSVESKVKRISPREIWLDENSNTPCLDKFLLRRRSYLSSTRFFSLFRIIAWIISIAFTWFGVYEFLLDSSGDMQFSDGTCQFLLFKYIRTSLSCLWISLIFSFFLNLLMIKRLKNYSVQKHLLWLFWVILFAWSVILTLMNSNADNNFWIQNANHFWASYILSGIVSPILLACFGHLFVLFRLRKQFLALDATISFNNSKDSPGDKHRNFNELPQLGKEELLNNAFPAESDFSRSKNSKTELSKFSSVNLQELFFEALTNEKIRHEFEFFLMSELSIENLILYDAATLFLKDFAFLNESIISSQPKENLETAYEVAYHIYTDFMLENSPFNVNIAHERRTQFTEFFAKKVFSSDLKNLYQLIRSVQWDMEILMKNDSFARFRSTPEYRKAASEMKDILMIE